jgi:DNA-binding transcriptional LysR family regulator
MDLKDLRYSVAIADAGSFTRAAEHLHLAQQALSKQIGDLERELDVRLFVRVPRGTRLTPAGATFVEEARATLAQSERAKARARVTGRRDSETLRVGLMSCPIVIAAALAPLRSFRLRNPEVEIEIIEMAQLALSSAVRDGTLDVAIVCSSPDDSGALGGECVWERPLGAVLPISHPVAAQPLARLRDLADLPLITFSRHTNPVVYDSLLHALAHRGLKPRLAAIRAGGPPALVGPLVADGEGWALATADGSWPLYERIPGILFRPFSDPPILARWWAVWLCDSPSALVGRFISTWQASHGAHALSAPELQPMTATGARSGA